MKLNEVKTYTLGVLRGTFKNKDVLDKISAEGKNLRFEGKNLGDSYMFEGVENYSEDEIIIGRWIDGRPIYRKVVIKDETVPQATKNGTVVSTNYDITNLNINQVINMNGFACDNTFMPLPAIPFAMTGTVKIWISGTNTLVLGNSNTAYNTVKATAWIEYTKTTDAPGSASDLINAPTNFVDGGVHSENEVVVGQWIDGKPLYRKVIKVANPVSGTKYTHNLENIEAIIRVSGYVMNGSAFEPINTNATKDYYTGIYDISNTHFSYTGGAWKTSNLHVVFEYTKTTDEPQDMSITSTLTTVASDEEVAEVFA